MESDTREAMTPEPEMTLEISKVLQHGMYKHIHDDGLACAKCEGRGFIAGHAAGVKESSSKYTPLMSYVRHRDNCSWKKETSCACGMKKWIYRLMGEKE